MPRRAGCPRAADGHGRRVTETPVAGATQYKVYTSDGQLRHNGDGNGGNRFIYLGNSLIATENVTGATATNRLYEHTDALGSRVARWRTSDNTLTRFAYAPYGESYGAIPGGIGYTGHEGDADTGLIYMQQRYYDPLVGRFLSVDPMLSDMNNGWNFNRFNYAANNPYKFTDPDGRSIYTKLIKLAINGGDVAQTIAGLVEDANTVRNPSASIGQRVLAGASIVSEALPVSVGDLKDGARMVGSAVEKVKKTYYSRVRRAEAHKKADEKCEYCGKPTQMDRPFQQDSAEGDHFDPQSRGGETTDENLVSACRQCNGPGEKSDKIPGEEWQPPKPNERVQDKLRDRESK